MSRLAGACFVAAVIMLAHAILDRSAGAVGGVGGACCTFDDCLPAADEAECSALGGVFLAGEDCATDPCATGACCFGLSCAESDAFTCVTNGRDFAGAGTSCLDDPCDAGVGACCFGDGTCQDASPEDCAAAGGTWLGAGTLCANGPCLLGACCSTNDCVNEAQHECDQPDETFFVGEDCATNPCNECPAGTLFAQQRDGPLDFTAGTSEQSAGFIRFDDFQGVAGSIEAVTWWGVDLEHIGNNQFIECVESDPTFNITFHEDAGGVPGAVVCSYTLLATRTPMGILYLGAELNEYRVSLPAPCVLVNGWIAIEGLGDPQCWFLWMSAGVGTSHCEGCQDPNQPFELSLCLVGTEGGVFGACCDDSTGACNDNVEITDCAAAGQRFSPNQLCADLDPACGTIIGACCFPDTTCSIETQAECGSLGGNWLGQDTICISCPCLVPCPVGGIPEGEPVCETGYVDEFNGGCDAETVLFSPIALGDTVCGEGGVFEIPGDNDADFDWYEINVGAVELVWSVEAQFTIGAWIVDANAGCAGAVILDSAGVTECDTVTVSAQVSAGTYWLVVGAIAFTDEAVCGATYKATATVACPADLNGDGHVNVVDFLELLAAWGT
ncbi:MAG: hypothetical protein ACYSU7_13870, partial [Planctomycetota bacterium]